MKTAAKQALKPIAKQLGEYRAETKRLSLNCERWSEEAFNEKLVAITQAAHNGNEEAALAIETGQLPSRASYAEMHAKAASQLDAHERSGYRLYGQAAELIEAPMRKKVDQGQALLGNVLRGLGVPPFELQGASNHVGYVLGQLTHASKGETADLEWFNQLCV